jgi:transketolase
MSLNNRQEFPTMFARERLARKATEIRLAVLEAIHKAQRGHIGGAFSIVEILVSLYYGTKGTDSSRKWLGAGDSFILSKGHAAVAQYAVLADLGYITREEFLGLNQGGMLGEHPSPITPGIEFVSGSLGHGLSVGCGMALADRLDGKGRSVFILMGDGECYEGSVWEAAMFASHHKLGRLCAVVDRNGFITHGKTESFIQLEPFSDKWRAFGWNVIPVNAHDFRELEKTWASVSEDAYGMPTLVIANSIKGRGVSFMENNAKWHHGAVDGETFARAKAELMDDHHVD